MVGGGEVGMEVPVVALAARMMRWAVGGRRSHPFVSFSFSRWVAMTGRSDFAVCNWIAMLVRTPVRPRWSCEAGLSGLGRLMSFQRWNQTRARFYTQRESGVAMRMWTLWSRISPASSLDKQSCPMDRRTWMRMARCCAFAGPTEDGGVRRDEIPVGASGSGMDRMCPCRRS